MKILKKHHCYKKRSGGNHDIWYSPHTNKLFQVPRHGNQDAGTGLVNSILKQAGIK
ncbi:type II toxin-antitoxin system HicA family toxin [Selenomonas sputigena]|uniref:type II toxin-antitoxin system HicA family toxin n=1 Tax=Selenomonas sputigena TaxID=69823 RepID=UPI002E0E4777